jgi:hypothetical protein
MVAAALKNNEITEQEASSVRASLIAKEAEAKASL